MATSLTVEEINHLSGLRFATAEDAEAFYGVYAPKDEEVPIDEAVPLFRYLEGSKSWKDVRKLKEAADAAALASSDVKRAIYDDDKMVVDDPESLNAAIEDAIARYAPRVVDSHLRVWIRWIDHARAQGLIPSRSGGEAMDPSKADFIWAKARCFLAGAGWPAHRWLAKELAKVDPDCPLAHEETEADWHKALKKAHDICGIPQVCAWLDWGRVARAWEWTKGGGRPPWWLRALALFHCVAHIRCDEVVSATKLLFRLAIVYAGKLAVVDVPAAPLGAESGGCYQAVLNILGLPKRPAGEKNADVNPMVSAMRGVLEGVNPKDWLPSRKMASKLGGDHHLVWGPWSTLVPGTGPEDDPLFNWGVRPDGVWILAPGKTTREATPADVALDDVPWNYMDAHTEEKVQCRSDAYNALPDTVESGVAPWGVFQRYFPNAVCAPAMQRSFAAIFDALFVLDLLRSSVWERPVGRGEFPLILAMPLIPSLDQATETGKTQAAKTIAGAFAPGIPVVRPLDQSSAPNGRSIASLIREWGTACLDEWHPSQNDGALTSYGSVQSLTTGGHSGAGKVMQNGGSVRLYHSLVASCKALSGPLDLISRSVPVYLRAFTKEERANGTALQGVTSGKASMEIRAAAIALIDQYQMVEWAKKVRPASSDGFRFPWLREVARFLGHHVYGLDELGEDVDRCGLWMRSTLVEHETVALQEGVIAFVTTGCSHNFRLTAAFAGLENPQLQLLADYLSTVADADGCASVSSLLRGIASVMGIDIGSGSSGGGLIRLMRHWGLASRQGVSMISDHACACLVASQIRVCMPSPGSRWILPGHLGALGWWMQRGPGTDQGAAMRIRLLRQFKEPQ